MRGAALIRRLRLRDERGFSLTELLVAMLVGMVVLLAAFMVLDRSFSASGQIADRTDALQRGRLTMDLITRQLRSQVCVGTAKKPMVSGTDNVASFYADLSDGSQPIRQRTLTFNNAAGTLTESVVTGAGTYPTLTFTGTPTTKTLLTNVKQVVDGSTPKPFFEYWGYVGNTATLAKLTTPLSADTLGRVALIKIRFRAFAPRPLDNDSNSVVLEDDVYVRVAVPAQLQGTPECI
jgi:type II secretory pathway pseudopilin PulG